MVSSCPVGRTNERERERDVDRPSPAMAVRARPDMSVSGPMNSGARGRRIVHGRSCDAPVLMTMKRPRAFIFIDASLKSIFSFPLHFFLNRVWLAKFLRFALPYARFTFFCVLSAGLLFCVFIRQRIHVFFSLVVCLRGAKFHFVS